MKTIDRVRKIGFLAFAVLFIMNSAAESQQLYAGHWEGKFMGDFKTIIQIEAADENNYSGKIQMFSGGSMVQDDELSKITISESRLTFYIQAKQSEFDGDFNEDLSELTGHFIFPDQSRHPITLNKVQVDDQNNRTSQDLYLDNREDLFPAGKLISDVNYLMKSLIENHPQLYQYTAEEFFKKEWERTLMQLNQDLALEDYFKLVAPLVEKVQCSHTGIRMPAHYQQAVNQYGSFLPLELVCKEHKAYFISSISGRISTISPGSEILSINDVPVSKIIDQMLRMVPAEGGCITTKYNEINQNFHSYFYLFDHSEAFKVEFIADGSMGSINFSACNHNQVKSRNNMEEQGLPVEFLTDQENDVSVVSVSSFGIRDMDGYMQQLEQLFLELQANKISNLVIDLRNNSGGHPIFAAQLLSYLTNSEFTYFKRNPDIQDFEPLYHPMQASPNSFKGNLYVLVNGGCLSTTGHLISLLKYHTDAIFIGEEPGSSFYCNDFSMQVTLPNTGIEVNIPRTTFETAVTGFQIGEPFNVDHYVNNTVSDIIGGTDSYLSRVYQLIDEKRIIP